MYARKKKPSSSNFQSVMSDSPLKSSKFQVNVENTVNYENYPQKIENLEKSINSMCNAQDPLSSLLKVANSFPNLDKMERKFNFLIFTK